MTTPMREMTVEQASRIFRAMNGDVTAQMEVTLQDTMGMVQADTFGEFLLKNHIQTYEEVIRK